MKKKNGNGLTLEVAETRRPAVAGDRSWHLKIIASFLMVLPTAIENQQGKGKLKK